MKLVYPWDFRRTILFYWEGRSKVLECDFFVTEGNTFEVLSLLRERGLDKIIKEAFKNGSNKVYIGASAGAMISGESIAEAA